VLHASHPTAMVDYYVNAFEQQNSGVRVELITAAPVTS
jgi:hypothetical protein